VWDLIKLKSFICFSKTKFYSLHLYRHIHNIPKTIAKWRVIQSPLQKRSVFRQKRLLFTKLNHSLFKRTNLSWRSVHQLFFIPVSYLNEILSYFRNIIQVDYVAVVWLGEEVFVEDGFPMLYGVVGFEFSVRQVQHGLSVLNDNAHYLVGIDNANILATCSNGYADGKITVYAVIKRYKQIVTAVIYNRDIR